MAERRRSFNQLLQFPMLTTLLTSSPRRPKSRNRCSQSTEFIISNPHPSFLNRRHVSCVCYLHWPNRPLHLDPLDNSRIQRSIVSKNHLLSLPFRFTKTPPLAGSPSKDLGSQQLTPNDATSLSNELRSETKRNNSRIPRERTTRTSNELYTLSARGKS